MRHQHTHTGTHKLQGLRESERELERVGCYLFITLSCSQEATSPRSCKHTETQASVSSNPGNNKWSPHTSTHTHMWEVCTNTYTHVVHICPDIAKTRQHLPWDRMKTKEDYNARQSFDNLPRICKPALHHHKRTADMILRHDKLIFVLSYLLWLNINWIRRIGRRTGKEIIRVYEVKKEEMCWRNGIWHPCVKIASPANTFAIISLVQHGVAQAALRPPYGARRQHLYEAWAAEEKLRLLWLAFLPFPQGLLHYHNVRAHDGTGINWHLWCEGCLCVGLHL